MKLTTVQLTLLDDIREKLIQALGNPSENHQVTVITNAPNGEQIEVKFTTCLSQTLETIRYLLEIFEAATSDEERQAVVCAHQFSLNKYYSGTLEEQKSVKPIIKWWAMYCMRPRKKEAT